MGRLVAILFVGLLVFTAACSEEETSKKEKNPNETGVKVENDEESAGNKEKTTNSEGIEVVSIESKDDLKRQIGGVFLNNLSFEEELSTDTDQFMATMESELLEELRAIKTEDPKEIESELIRLLGSPNFKEAIEISESFVPDFEEPYLPYPNKKGNTVANNEIGKAIILLDASSSMLLSVDGKVKMDIAKDAVKRFADAIGQDSDVSLVVYGHKGSESNSDKQLSCEGIEEIYPMGEFNSDAFGQALHTFESKGWTPLAGAINKASEMSKELEGAITVYIVSDGVETCDGDPVKAAENFVNNNEERSVNIIGFNVDQKAEDQLVAVSEAGNGKYFAANNAEEIQKTIEYEWLPSLIDLAWAFQKAPGPWEIMAERDVFYADHEKIRSLIEKENDRFKYAMSMISEEELIPSEIRSEVNDLISNGYSIRMDIYREMQSQKIDEIDEIAKEIRERVDEWVEEMRELRDSQ